MDLLGLVKRALLSVARADSEWRLVDGSQVAEIGADVVVFGHIRYHGELDTSRAWCLPSLK